MKKTIGYVLLVLSFVPWGLVAVLPFLELSKTEIAGATTMLIVTAEVIFVAAIALLGKEAWAHIKARFNAKK